MTEKLSPEVKKAIEQVLSSLTETKVWPYVNIGKVIGDIEARLSPGYPPKGTICETWDDNEYSGGTYGHEVHVSSGDGTFGPWADGRLYPENIEQDHYRVIPTARDALDLLQRLTRFGGSEGVVMAANLYKDAIQDLIDHAMEG